MPTIQSALAEAQRQLLQAGGDAADARIEARLLLQHVLNVPHAWLLTHMHDALGANDHAEFEALLLRRIEGEPIAYIVGKREFYGLELAVTPATLIPRPDTETLVEAALQKIPLDFPSRILDLGTGTGAIALAIAAQRPQATVTAVDRSADALNVAQDNNRRLGLRVNFVLSNWFSALQNEQFDLIVSNPPYIAEADPHLQQGDLRFEPVSALAAGPDGLADVRHIISGAPAFLKPGGWLLLEHGYDQAAPVNGLLQEAGFSAISHAYDIAGIARVSLGQHECTRAATHGNLGG